VVADRFFGDSPARDEVLPSGVNRAENEVAWARNNLRVAGLIDSPERGIWRLTASGWAVDLAKVHTLGDHGQIVRRLSAELTGTQPLNYEAATGSEASIESEFNEPLTEVSNPVGLIDVVQALPPEGFERLCQKLLRSIGLREVKVTGRSGDQGIDGHGILALNDLVSVPVLFQCKRYQGSVGPAAVRDFLGAMVGRSNHGVILTTGHFTRDAQSEAKRDNHYMIQLVDADRLQELMESHQIGVTARTVYDVDQEFFAPFMDPG